ncbi:MAG: flagellar basal body L-ring protein FlgH [Phycisphaerales bacterium]
MNIAATSGLIALVLLAAPCAGQSLFQRPIKPAPASDSSTVPESGDSGSDGSAGAPREMMSEGSAMGPTMQDASLMAVVPPKPRQWAKHDKVELIINQTSLQKAEQKLETKKDYDVKAELRQFPSLRKLIEDATIGDGIGTAGPSVDVGGTSDFKGSGKGERKDRFTARISAIVIEVKPNGHLVLEAREVQQFDDDIKTLVVAGLCDPKDITVQGTVLSTQVANLVIRVENTGSVKDGSQKGWIPRLLDSIFGL